MWTEPGIWVTPWGIAFVMAMFVMWFFSRRNSRAAGIDPSHLDLLVPLSLLGGIAVALAAYSFAGLQIRLFEIVLGGAVVVFAYGRIAGVSFRSLLDVLALPTLAGVMVQRIGCVFAGCCWGDAAAHAWQPGIVYARDSFAYLQQLQAGLINEHALYSLPVHPVQIYESLLLFAALVVLHRMNKVVLPPGRLAAITACVYASMRFLLEFIRADSEELLSGLSYVQLQSVLLLGLVITIWTIAQWRNRHAKITEVVAV
ncbi:MAG: prolipoprotein diacylglyceryl transferase family protein [Woeseiaceae bacterium]